MLSSSPAYIVSVCSDYLLLVMATQGRGTLTNPQYHTPPSLQLSSRQTWPALHNLQQQPYDGVVEITVRRLQDFVDARNDPYYLDTVVKDEECVFLLSLFSDVPTWRCFVSVQSLRKGQKADG